MTELVSSWMLYAGDVLLVPIALLLVMLFWKHKAWREEHLPLGILFLLHLVSNVWKSSSLVTFRKLFMWLKVVSASK